MKTGLLLALLSFAAMAAAILSYQPRVKVNKAPLRPRFQQASMVVALLLAGGALVLGDGIAGYALASLAAIPAALFLLGTLASGLPSLAPAVAIGALAPDFTLLDSEGHRFRLASLRGAPVLLKFYRGYWCPYCVAELDQLNGLAREFAELGVRLAALSSDTVEELAGFRRNHPWKIMLLADPGLRVHHLYNLAHRTFALRRGPFRELAIPTTMLIGSDGRILWLEQSSDFRVRPQAAALLAKARLLLPREPAGKDASPGKDGEKALVAQGAGR